MMKRKSNLYQEICNIEHITYIYEQIEKKCKNKNKIYKWESIKDVLITRIYKDLTNYQYQCGKYHRFVIYEPKKRIIKSQEMYDKVVNHLVSEYILLPSIVSCLIDSNVASRREKGTNYGIKLYYKYRQFYDSKYGKNNYYLLKLDIHHFFDSIDHEILKSKLETRIKDKNALDILNLIIDSTESGLPIGSTTSQLFAIFFLDSIDKYIKEVLKIKCYIRYQDDMLLIHHDKNYLKYCFKKITEELHKLKLQLNSKSRIYKSSENINFIGVRKNKKYTNIARTRRKYKKNLKKYDQGEISLNSLISSRMNYFNRKKGVILE